MQRLQSQLRLLGVVWAAAFAVIATASVMGRLQGHGLTDLTRDPLAVAGAPWYLGFLSNLGVLAWWGTAAVCATAAFVVRAADGPASDRRVLEAAAAVTALLAVDDLFQLHERFELPVYLFYAGVIGVCIRRYARFIGRTRWFTLVAALVLLSASVGIDYGSEKLGVELNGIEDLLKLLGIAAWAAYFVRFSARAIGRSFAHATRANGWQRQLVRNANARRARDDVRALAVQQSRTL